MQGLPAVLLPFTVLPIFHPSPLFPSGVMMMEMAELHLGPAILYHLGRSYCTYGASHGYNVLTIANQATICQFAAYPAAWR